MLKRKQCPKCKGDIRFDRDEYGWYEECLMCGHTQDLRVMTKPQSIQISRMGRAIESSAVH